MTYQIWEVCGDGVRRPLAQAPTEAQAQAWGDLLAMAFWPARIEVAEVEA